MRKDVECTFGILKGCFWVLKTGICLQGTENADKIWCTCCVLHNWLLEVDGLGAKWEGGIPSHWPGEMGSHDDDAGAATNFASCRLHLPTEL
jgi:hypothetical protein